MLFRVVGRVSKSAAITGLIVMQAVSAIAEFFCCHWHTCVLHVTMSCQVAVALIF